MSPAYQTCETVHNLKTTPENTKTPPNTNRHNNNKTAAIINCCLLQEAERKIPINYASRYKSGALARQAYLPFKVNATGVMPVIFSSSLLAIPAGVARFTNSEALAGAAQALAPGGPLYLPTNIALIVAFNYYYTFLQLDPNDLSDQLKRQVRMHS